MNPNRIVYGRVTINDDRIDLGRSPVETMIKRFIEQYARKRYDGEKLRLVIELADEPLAFGSILSREQQLEAEMQSMIAAPKDEIFPGITAAYAGEVIESPEYVAYEHICEPTHRIGVPDETIESIREAYRLKYPDCYQFFPLWRA